MKRFYLLFALVTAVLLIAGMLLKVDIAQAQYVSYIPGSAAPCSTHPSALELCMTDGSGTTVTDFCCSNNFTITPGTGSWQTLAGVAHGVYQFDGTTTKMVGANFTNLNFNFNSTFSVFGIVQLISGGSTTQPVITHTTTNHLGWDVTMESGALAFLLCHSYPTAVIDVHCFTCAGWPAGALHDFVITYNGNGLASGVKFYEDGVDDSASPSIIHDNLGGASTTTSTVPNVGLRPEDSQFIKGYIGPVFVWNRVLTSTEAANLHTNPYLPPN